MSNITGTIRLTTAQALAAGINIAYYKGEAAYLHIRYASTAMPTDNEMSIEANDFVGFCANHEETAPTTASSYTWARINSASVQDAVEAFMESAATNARAAAASETVATQKASDAEQSATDAEAAQAAAESAQSAAEMARDAAQVAQNAAQTAQAAAETAQTEAEAAESGAETDAAAAETSRAAAEAAQTAAETARDAAQAAQSAAETAQNAAEAAQSHSSDNAIAAQTAKDAAQTAQAQSETARDAAQDALTAAETAETNAEASATAALGSASAAAQSAAQAALSAEAAGRSHPLVNVSPDLTGAENPVAGGAFTVVDDIRRDMLGHVEQVSTKTVTMPATVDVAALRDYDPTNKWGSETGGGGIPNMVDRLFYFKSNLIGNANDTYRTGAYGVRNTDTTMPYLAWWYLLVFCKDENNQISVQWAFPVNAGKDGELWLRIIRRKEANYGTWKRMATASMVDAVVSDLSALGLVVEGKADASHTHEATDIQNLEASLTGKANAVHTHEPTDILNLEASLTGKANVVHTHEPTDINNLEASLTGKADTVHTHVVNDVTDLPDALAGKANTAHTHEATDINNLEASLIGKANAIHTHEPTDILNLEASLTGKANATHTHAQAEVTGLADALAGKAASVHTHAQADVTGLADALAGKAAAAHTHVQADVTGLSTALAGKAAASHTHSQYLTAHQDISGKANTSQVVPLSATANVNGSFDRSSTTPTGTSKLNYSGYFEATRIYGGYYSDYAEFFDVRGNADPGDVVALDPDTGEIRRCERDASPLVVGVVSNAYFICIGRKEGQANIPIGLAGKLPVKVRGACRAGDSLVSAGDGFARALRDGETPPFGAVLGMALEAKADPTPALVQMLIK